MDIASKILSNQDRDGMLRRSLERIIQLYPDKSHFVYELLQNAEDSGASGIRFVQYPDRLEVMHDGHAFTTENLQGLCDIGQSDKVNNLNQIGEFGVGFKSVFGICDKVRLYSRPRQKEISENCQPFAIEIQDFTRPVDIAPMDIPSGYTTLFVFPYSIGFTFSGFKSIKLLNEALTKRLKNLGVTTLLFMHSLSLIEYEVKIPGENASGQYMLDEEQLNDHCTQVSAIETDDKKTDESLSFIKFSMPIASSASNRTIDIAFTVVKDKNGHESFQKAKSPYISVYFPTETESKLGFIVQGPFRTTPNRSSVPADDDDNIALAQQMAKLLRRSILELRDMGRLDLSLIKILPLEEEDFWNYDLFAPLCQEVQDIFAEEKVLPINAGAGYVDAEHALIARSKDLTDLFSSDLISKLYNDGKHYEWLPITLTETGPFKDDVYPYFSSTLGIEVIRPEDLRSHFNENLQFLRNQPNEWMIRLYKLYETVPNIFSETNYRNILDAIIVRTESNRIVAPYRKSERTYVPNVFLPNAKVKLSGIEVVAPGLYDACKKFFEHVLLLKAPDEYEFFIKSIQQRYAADASQVEHGEHIDDVTTFVKHLKNPDREGDVRSIIKDSFYLRCRVNNQIKWLHPFAQRILFPQSEDGLMLEKYYLHVADDIAFIDYDMYQSAGFTYADLRLFGITDNILTGTERTYGEYQSGNPGRQPTWSTNGHFRWKLSIDKVEDVLTYISQNPAATDSMIKSQVIFKLLQHNADRLVGDVWISGQYVPNKHDEPAEIIHTLRKDGFNYRLYDWDGRWVYTESKQLVAHKDISKHDLNKHLYGQVSLDSNLYDLLGFKKGRIDQVEAVVKEYDAIPQEKKDDYFKIELERRFHITPEQLSATMGSGELPQISTQPADEFEFPTGEVRNWEALKKHAAQILTYAQPVKYERIVRSIRISRPEDDIRAYLMNMYRVNATYKYACQLCHKPSGAVEMCQLEQKPELELEPLNICLCPNCAQRFKAFRNETGQADRLIEEILDMTESDITSGEHISIRIRDFDFWFTQTHLAEIAELLRLKKYADEHGKTSAATTTVPISRPIKVSSAVPAPQSKQSETQQAQPVATEKPEEILRSDADIYLEYVGKRVYHRTQKRYAKVIACDGQYFTLRFETGDKAGKDVNYSMAMCIDNRWLEVVE